MGENREDASIAETSEIERLREEVRSEHDMYLRALADFDNYRKRVERERASLAQSGKRVILLSLLELMDGFDRALQHAGEDPAKVLDGLQVIQRQLAKLLDSQGVKALESRGQEFNPELHEAIGSAQADDYKPGTIVDEVQRGYLLGNELLRPARVRVAQ